MEQVSSKLEYTHIDKPTKDILKYIDDRRKGVVRSLRTKWLKFNRQCMGGIEPNAIYTIAGISGSGKSSFANSLETDLFDLNSSEDFVVLSFSFEMLSSKQVGRKLSYKTKRTTSELYSGNSDQERISDEVFHTLKKHSETIRKYPVYYVDSPGTVEQIKNTIFDFAKTVAKGRWLVIFFDHTLLTRGKLGEKERETLADLQRMFMEIKKYGKNTIIQLSQMNREIESVDRLNNSSMHYPVRRDLFGGDSVFQASDYVIVLHRPELLGIDRYGQSNLPVQNLIYMHFLKVREGEPKILVFKNNLKYNSIEEININEI
jgi:replicative DNA helicase